QNTLSMMFTDRRLSTDLLRIIGSDLPVEEIEFSRDHITEYLETTLASQDEYSEFFVYDLVGNVIFSSNPNQIGKRVNRRPYFEHSVEAAHIQSPYYEVGGGELTIVATLPLKNEREEVVGVLAGRFNMGVLAEVMTQHVGMGETGETYLVSVENNYLLTPSRFEGYPENHSYQSEGIGAVLHGRDGTGIYASYRGPDVIGAYRWLPDLEVGLLAEMQLDEALSNTWNTTAFSILAAVVAGTIAIGVGFFLAMRVTEPIIQLTGTTRLLSGGDLAARSSIAANNEVGELSTAFNQMADNLQDVLDREAAARQNLEGTVAQYVKFAQQVANGDLTVRLTLPEEHDHAANEKDAQEDLYHLGWNLNAMAEGLSVMTRQIRETASNVSAAASEILAATMQQLASTTEQDASVTQTVATVGEVQGTVTQTAERANSVAEAAHRSVEVSERGMQAVNDSASSMEMIQDRVEDIAHNILALSERTQQIGVIISTVNDIADQSKLLALNASIEAARAGEEGRGFAVVAMEVRALAEQSRQATEQIGAILHEIQQATNVSVMATEEGSKGVDEGVMQLNETGAVIEELAQVIRAAAQASSQIAASTHQQSTGMDQLVAAMEAIRQATLHGQASVQQSEKSAQQMSQIAQEMQESIAKYRV
ncbi:methyl-accepting chemotaxis protein, partial [Chloroflexota bacterium]